jgi:hypothetical protein
MNKVVTALLQLLKGNCEYESLNSGLSSKSLASNCSGSAHMIAGKNINLTGEQLRRLTNLTTGVC